MTAPKQLSTTLCPPSQEKHLTALIAISSYTWMYLVIFGVVVVIAGGSTVWDGGASSKCACPWPRMRMPAAVRGLGLGWGMPHKAIHGHFCMMLSAAVDTAPRADPRCQTCFHEILAKLMTL